MSTPADCAMSLLDRFLTAIAARDHTAAGKRQAYARRERSGHCWIRRAMRLERDSARREADSAELRAMRGER